MSIIEATLIGCAAALLMMIVGVLLKPEIHIMGGLVEENRAKDRRRYRILVQNLEPLPSRTGITIVIEANTKRAFETLAASEFPRLFGGPEATAISWSYRDCDTHAGTQLIIRGPSIRAYKTWALDVVVPTEVTCLAASLWVARPALLGYLVERFLPFVGALEDRYGPLGVRRKVVVQLQPRSTLSSERKHPGWFFGALLVAFAALDYVVVALGLGAGHLDVIDFGAVVFVGGMTAAFFGWARLRAAPVAQSYFRETVLTPPDRATEVRGSGSP
jgi:hypothetical protein